MLGAFAGPQTPAPVGIDRRGQVSSYRGPSAPDDTAHLSPWPRPDGDLPHK